MYFSLVLIAAVACVGVSEAQFTPTSQCGIQGKQCYDSLKDRVRKKLEETDYAGACKANRNLLSCLNGIPDSDTCTDIQNYKTLLLNTTTGICDPNNPGSLTECADQLGGCVNQIYTIKSDFQNSQATKACPLIKMFETCSSGILTQNVCPKQITDTLTKLQNAMSEEDMTSGCDGPCAQLIGNCTLKLVYDITNMPVYRMNWTDFCIQGYGSRACVEKIPTNSGPCTRAGSTTSVVDDMMHSYTAYLKDYCDANGQPSKCMIDLDECRDELVQMSSTANVTTQCQICKTAPGLYIKRDNFRISRQETFKRTVRPTEQSCCHGCMVSRKQSFSQCSLFRLSLRCLIPLVLAVAFIQLAIYLWSVRWHAKGAALTPMVRKDVQASKEALGTCSYQLCPKVAEGKLNIHLIPHSHIDVGWTHTVDEYYTGVAVGTGCVQCTLQRTVEELAKNPDRRFIFIEMKYLSRFWSEINDTERSLIRQLINERRLELVGGGWVMSDSGVTMYNDIIDQHTLGFDFITNTFGHCAHARGAWHVDLFGYSREHASILSQMGYDSLILNRIDFQEHEHRKKSKTQEFLWLTSPQNLKNRSTLFTSLLTDGYWAPDGYVMDKEIVAPEVTKNVADLFVNLIKEWAKNYQSKHIVVPVGSDFAFINAKHKDVHLLYSTPSCYAHSVNQERLTLDTKIDDFLPYSIPPAAFWTGFYTTRGGFKKHIKQAGQILQSCKQLSIFTDLNDSYDEVNVLRDALGVMQHHDAITGTQRHHVLLDYNRILSNATSMCQQVMAKAYRKLWNRSETGSNEMAPQFCFGLNISSCQVSEEESQVEYTSASVVCLWCISGVLVFLVTVYNPLSWSFDFEVRFPVSYQSMAVTDASGEQVFYQVVPIHDHIVRIPERIPSTAVSEAVLLTRLPPMSVTTFIVQQGKGKPVTKCTN
ncbi:Lysosomal alpha-mannosidase [Bulinus truncatus]|nr:Lysosomal alpha-mannosidase [Bulinus truncatus]